jgi:hypothetical protein
MTKMDYTDKPIHQMILDGVLEITGWFAQTCKSLVSRRQLT